MKSSYGSKTRSAVISLSNFRFSMFFPPMRSPKSKARSVPCERQANRITGSLRRDVRYGFRREVSPAGYEPLKGLRADWKTGYSLFAEEAHEFVRLEPCL